jgi:arsenite methyltransferase
MAERVFASKLRRIGFVDVVIEAHAAFSVNDAARYPLFTSDLIAVMRRAIPPERQHSFATSVIVRARKPE